MSNVDGPRRFFALDSVRAAAMLLGVGYHTMLFRMFAGGMPPGPMGSPGASRWVQDWLHGFRMPLFFLVSGFFGCMILEKYGTRRYLRRRWSRIAIPLFISIFTFGPAYVLTRDMTSGGPGPGFGPMDPPPGGVLPPGPLPPGGPGAMPAPPPGFVPPPLQRFGENHDGTLDADEWKRVSDERPAPPGMGPGPGPGSGSGGPMPGPIPFGSRGGGPSERIFGSYSRYFELHHLWFLWYLLLFATVAPWVTKALGWFLPRPTAGFSDSLGLRILGTGIAPFLLGAITMPALMMASGPMGWTLGLSPAIFRGFPDFLLHLEVDMPFYFLYFLTGWWLYRERTGLESLARLWLPELLLGLFAFTAASTLGQRYAGPMGVPTGGGGSMRFLGSLLYCLGSAATSLAFLGFFQRYLDRPSRVWRYLADTALWVYLIHQPLVLFGLAIVRPLLLTWWAQTAIVFLMASSSALVLYELLVRHTPMVHVFGPATASKPAANSLAGEPSTTAV